MEEKVQMLSNMSLTFEGQNSIDAEVLMSSLSGAIKAYRATLSAEYDGQGAEISLNIKAFAPGSVEVLLESVVGIVPIIAPYVPTLIDSTKTFLEIVKIKKELKGKKPQSVEQEGDKTKITNNEGETHYHDSTVYNFYINNPSIDAGLASMFSALGGSSRPAVSFSAHDKKIEIAEDDFQNMSVAVVDDLKKAECNKMESVVDAHLLVKSPDLLGNSKWDFHYDGKIIHAAIEDERFMESVRKGEIKLYAGVRLPVRMKIEAYINEKLEVEQKVYTVLEVIGDLIDSTDENPQLLLEGFKDE